MKRFIAILLISMLVIACDRDENPATPENNLILEESFENTNDQPTYDKWTVAPNLASFASETPEDGGSWSLQLEPGWAPQEGFAEKSIGVPEGSNTYTLSAWVKGQGYILMGLQSENGLIDPKKVVNESDSWQQLSITNTFDIKSGDKLYVKLSAGMTEIATWKVLVDLVIVEKVNE